MRVLTEANDIVRRKWRNAGRGWKVLLATGIIIASIIGLILFIIWMFIQFLRSLSIGGTQNHDLYFPRSRR